MSASVGEGNDLSSMINSRKTEEIGVPAIEGQPDPTLGCVGDRPFDGDDLYKAYNITAKITGAFNEWRDKKQEWDDLVQNLNTQVFKNKDFKES